ncbi:MAG: sulfide dehydrogenase cytochrome subunit [Oceanicoccus sp.]|jgi:sulfide dehydrogenase cytochrome subunit
MRAISYRHAKQRLLSSVVVLACTISLAEVVYANDALDRASAMVSACSSCHSDRSVDPGTEAPVSLKTLSSDEIEQALLAFRSGDRVGTLMNRLARGYSKAEIAAMAKVLATQ